MVDDDGAESHSFIDFPNFMTFVPIWKIGQTVKKGPFSWCSLFLLCAQTNFKMDSPSVPCLNTPHDTLGTTIGDSVSTHSNTIHAATPRPSADDNTFMSDKSVDEEALQNDLVATDILAFGEHIARMQSRDLSPQQQTVAIEALSAMISTLRGTSKNRPVDLDTSPPSSNQGKSS